MAGMAGCPAASGWPEGGADAAWAGAVGAVSAVSCAAGTVLCLNACRRMRLGPWRRSGPLWVRVLSGPVRVVGDGEVFQAGAEDGRLVMVRSGPVVVELGPGSRALLVVPAPGIGPAGAPPAPTTARGLVDDYLFRAGFFLDHADAVRGTRELIDRLTGALAADGRHPTRPLPGPSAAAGHRSDSGAAGLGL